ncbi:MAG: hypothetical protein ABJQ23_04540 [Shimia thalassica]|uniref:hypothetical protein n=1 Tax=Shimia thalassica TaxID=1715693 RepID=UPI003299DEB5
MIRSLIQILVVITFVGAASPAFAQGSAKDRIIGEMQAAGYSEIKVDRTLFGRTRIIGRTSDRARVVILNPKTGKIFEDNTGPIGPPPTENTPDGTGLAY